MCAFHHCGQYGPRHPTTLGPLEHGLSVQLRRTFHHHSVGASQTHLQEELLQNPDRIRVDTQYGPVTGGRANTGAIAFLEIPYALPPGRFQDPQSLPPEHHYEDKEYLYEASYCAQPKKEELIAGAPYENIVGLGEPTENPLFVNIVCPRDFKPSSDRKYPVKVYIHGGFLQLGSPHELNSQAQYIAAQRSEVWVNIGYRVSVFGFLASDEPKLSGNYGFKDQWLALLWIRDNIERFGGDPKDIQITGLSAGGHSVQQILHHATRGGLPPDGQAPFQSAMIQSNGILTNPETPSERRPQFEALCRSLGLDPRSPTILDQLRDPVALPWQRLTHVIETGKIGTAFDTFRGTLDGAQWLADDPDPITWQRSGAFARALRDKGV
ncbi:acetylcholine esterase, partial [Daedalea quercina L-15889]